MAEVVKNKFLKDFQRNLYSENSFWKRAKSDSGADENNTIEIPQSDTPISSTFGTIQAGQANLDNAASLVPKVRLNTKKTYGIETFGTDPVALQLTDLDTISYNKRQELFLEHQEVIDQDVADYAAIQYAQDTANAALIAKSTGAGRTNIVTGGLVGSVKSFTKNDIINVKRLFNRMNLRKIVGKMYALVTPEQYDDLLKIPEFIDYDKTGRTSKLEQGIVGTLLGFEFLQPRHNEALNANVVYNPATNAKTVFGAALTATETSAAIFWHSGMVRYSAGKGKLYQDKANPIYKSDIMSADARFGATKSRTDGRGVVSLVEDAV